MLQHWLLPQIQQDRDDFVFMPDDTSSHFHHQVHQYVNDTILDPCDFYLSGYIKDSMYILPVPATLQDLRDRIVTAVNSITRDHYFEFGKKWTNDFTFIA
ncbi:hypothetical protein AVEN_97060-1 [Araneus ventricosus]|uniref:Uncharacterized protein n=1 Tax=Araneus ventricosus TaxID=182803 RepID=A0A4Y2JGS2_ARAVE|nr:hypothetical protein AVEN_97060-1 [Araneus ventricosus]